MSGWDDADRDEPLPLSTVGLLAAVEARRNDAAFMERLTRNIAKHKPLLDRLADSPRGVPSTPTSPTDEFREFLTAYFKPYVDEGEPDLYGYEIEGLAMALAEAGYSRLRSSVANQLQASVTSVSLMLDHSYEGKGLCLEARQRRRLDKVATEVGEMLGAYEGYVGENPRKGVTDTLAHVCEELLDIAACALCAWESLNGNQGGSVMELTVQTVRKAQRLREAIEASEVAQ